MPDNKLRDARALGRKTLAEAKQTDEPRDYAYLLGTVEAALKHLLDALDEQDAGKS